jgi:protein associated with RNAse G/E
VYTDEDLNTMIYEYRKHQEISKKQFEIRKEDLKNNPDINKLINEENDMNIQRYIEQDKNIEENKEEIK